jgi:hypothetical protein
MIVNTLPSIEYPSFFGLLPNEVQDLVCNFLLPFILELDEGALRIRKVAAH